MNNTLSTRKRQYMFSLHKELFRIAPDLPCWEVLPHPDGDFYDVRKTPFLAYQKGCLARVFSRAAVVAKPTDLSAPIPSESEVVWQNLALKLDETHVTDDLLRTGLRQIRNKIGVCHWETENGAHRFFTTRTRGTKRYSTAMSWKLSDYIKDYVDIGYEAFFLTLTCDPKKYASRTDAWRNYRQKEIMPVLENLRKHKGCRYVGVLESTAKGYPHTHLVLFFPKGTIKGYDKMKNQQVLHFGWLFNEIKKRRFSPVTKLIVAKGDGVKFYLSKYIRKGTEADVLKLCDKKDAFTATERKFAYELVFTRALHLRSCFMCKAAAKGVSCASAAQSGVCVLSEEIEALGENEPARARAVLKALCTNSPLTCARSTSLMPLKTFHNLFHASPAEMRNPTPEQARLYHNHAHSFGCGGCFYTHFQEWVITGSNWLMENAVDMSKYNLENDCEWVECVREIVTFFFTAMYVK